MRGGAALDARTPHGVHGPAAADTDANPDPSVGPRRAAASVVDLANGFGPFTALPAHDSLVVTGVTRERLDDDTLYGLQGVLRPGGRIVFHVNGASGRERRRLARLVGHWFDGPPPGPGERFSRARFVPSPKGHTLTAYRAGGGTTMGHFEALASRYRGEIPDHLVRLYGERKLQRIGRAIDGAGYRVLDLGCGVGLYAREVAERFEANVTAVDASPASVGEARDAPGAATGHTAVRFAAADAVRLPFADASFDVAYTVNVVHHLKRGEQARLFAEAARVLRPGGRLLVFEINTRNPMFRFYMRHVFPRTRDIDRGDEEFVDPRRLPVPGTLIVEDVDTYTFLPDFLPRFATRLLGPAERAIEATPIRAWGIHFTATLRRQDRGTHHDETEAAT